MKKFPGRAKTVHVKPANGGDGRLVGDPNDGNLAKWPAIFEYDGGSMDQVERTAARLSPHNSYRGRWPQPKTSSCSLS